MAMDNGVVGFLGISWQINRQFADHHRNYGIRRTCYLKMFTRFTNFTFYALRKQFAKHQIQVYLVDNIRVWARADLIVNIKIYARIITPGNVKFVFMKSGRGQHKIYTYVLRFMFHVATANCLINADQQSVHWTRKSVNKLKTHKDRTSC